MTAARLTATAPPASLSAIAARADGWDYGDLLGAMLAGRWRAG